VLRLRKNDLVNLFTYILFT